MGSKTTWCAIAADCMPRTAPRLTTSWQTELRPRDITPLFRKEKDQQVVLLTAGVIRPEPSKTWVNVLLFALTMVSVFIAGALLYLGSEYQGPADLSFQALLPYLPSDHRRRVGFHGQPAGDPGGA